MEERGEMTEEESQYWKAVHIIETNKKLLSSEEGLDELRLLVGPKKVTRYLKEHSEKVNEKEIDWSNLYDRVNKFIILNYSI